MKKVSNISTVLGKRVREKRIEQNLSQKELSEKVNLSIQTISVMENSEKYNLRRKSIEKLSYHLMATEDYLKGLSNEPLKTEEGLTRGIFFPPDEDAEEQYILNSIDNYKEAFLLLAKCERKLNEKDKRRLINVIQAFLD